MAGQDMDVAVERQELPGDTVHQLLVVAPDVVGAANAAGKERVAAQEHAGFAAEEADTALGMTGRSDDFEFRFTERDPVAVCQVMQRAGKGLEGQAQLRAPFSRAYHLLPVERVDPRIDVPGAGHVFQAEDMVEMSVREQDLDRLELLLRHEVFQALQFPVPVVARVDEDAFPGRIPGHVAALPDRIEVEGLYFHLFGFEHTKIRKDVVNLTGEPKTDDIMHIAIAGNIGSGKTTLTRMLVDHFHWTPKYESVDYNPYLADFYNDMERWSFNIQIYFLNKRFLDVVEIAKHEEIIVQDRSIYEDACIFAPNLHNMGLMSTRDFENYRSLFSLMSSLVKAPDLLIYLRSSIPHLVGNIQKRGREYESSIRLDYLKGLNALYEDWIGNYTDGKLLILDVDKLNFEESAEDFSTICDRIEAQLNGLF